MYLCVDISDISYIKDYMEKNYWGLVHPFTTDRCVERLINEYKKHKNLIIAFDFDNTVFDYHKEGNQYEYEDVIELLKECYDLGMTLVLYTCEENIDKIKWKINWCKEYMKFTPHYVNKSPVLSQSYKNSKIYYNILLDDRAGLFEAWSILSDVVSYIEKDKGLIK